MSDFILRELKKALQTPTREEIIERLRTQPTRSVKQSGRRAAGGARRAVIVLEASAVLELLLGTAVGHVVADAIDDPDVGLHATHVLDVEVAQVLRRYVPATAS